jgi:hypothetical protein
MDNEPPSVRQVTERHLKREYDEIEAAIALVGSGEARSVGLTGLKFAETVAGRLTGQAADHGVTLELRWRLDDEGCDVVVRRTDD